MLAHRLHQVARARSPDANAAATGGHIAYNDRAICGGMAANPGQVMNAKGSAGDDLEAVGGQACHRQVALDPAASIEHLCVRNRADGLVHLIVSNILEEGQRAWSCDLQLTERSLVEEGDPFARGLVLGSDGWGPEASGPAQRNRPVLSLSQRLVRGKPIGALPAGFFAEDGTQFAQAIVDRAEAQFARAAALFERITDIVIRAVDLIHASGNIFLASCIGSEAPDVHMPQIEFRLALDDPFRQHLAHASRA